MSLKKMIAEGILAVPSEDCTDMLENIPDRDLETLVSKGEVLLSDGKGNAFIIFYSPEISIVKLPYQNRLEVQSE